MKRGWTISADTGGTFTDVIGTDPAGGRHRVKVLSSSALRGTLVRRTERATFEIEAGWLDRSACLEGLTFRLLGADPSERRVVSIDRSLARLVLDADLPVDGQAAFELVSPEPAPVFGARLLTGTPAGRPLPVEELRLATTRGTNALLQRRGASIALFITRGFADLLAIGDQRRPDLFARRIVKPEALQRSVVEVDERLAADGEVVAPLDPASFEGSARALLDDGIDVAAVALLHAYRNPTHERAVGRRLQELGFRHVVLSSDAAPRIKIVPRATTAAVDAFLAPILSDYLDQVRASLDRGRLRVMTSAGGLASPTGFFPRDGLLSGPAGGVVGAAAVARRFGLDQVVAFDMGGTSTDVSRVTGDFDYRFEHEVGGITVAAPALAIETVAAGGGSICDFDGQHLTIGPASAGADPGPACYGNGGPLTLTDVNLLSGRVVAERFGVPLALEAARRAFEDLCARCDTADPDATLDGLRAIADERMAGAVRQVSLRRGYDPAEHALVAFGGAGGQHACAVADRLGIDRVLVPADAGVLSAVGLSHAVLERFAERQVLRPMDEALPALPALLAELEIDARRRLLEEGADEGSIAVRRRMAFLRFAGQDATLEVAVDDPARLPARFVERYGELFGHDPGERPVEVDAVRVVVSSRARPEESEAVATPDPTPTERRQRARFDGAWGDAAVHDRESLPPGGTIAGPALVVDAHATAVIEPGWEARVEDDRTLRLRRIASPLPAADRQPASVERELFTHRFEQIAREMGERLRHTAVSTNVKERLDFSCALLDPEGKLVVNAPHIPVHLGALGLCVRTVAERVAIEPGDVVVTNHPAYGGSHLPDVTVITTIHADDGTHLGYAANRAHHAEIGGSRPGSMPPESTRLVAEGVVIPPTRLLRRGRPCWDQVTALLTAPPWPTRNLADNRADLEAAVAANHAGAEALRALAAVHGSAAVIARMGEVTTLAGERLARALTAFGDGDYRAVERLDDGTPLAVAFEIAGGRARIDFAGSGPVHPGNLNATPAIVRSAVLYVMRLLLDRPFPLNEGLMEPVSIVLPPSLLAPEFADDASDCPAVVGGNVETSQRLVDTLIKALKLAACSQGTMNNVLFGNDRVSYYETVCGGSGAGADFDGADAVHTHMTNTAITDPELLEHRYPVRVERFAIRRGSGGAGRRRGGDGVVRELTFLDRLELSLLSQHRVEAPYGMEGGEAGARGAQRVVRADGRIEELASIDARNVGPGDRLILETPAGGGWGRFPNPEFGDTLP